MHGSHTDELDFAKRHTLPSRYVSTKPANVPFGWVADLVEMARTQGRHLNYTLIQSRKQQERNADGTAAGQYLPLVHQCRLRLEMPGQSVDVRGEESIGDGVVLHEIDGLGHVGQENSESKLLNKMMK